MRDEIVEIHIQDKPTKRMGMATCLLDNILYFYGGY